MENCLFCKIVAGDIPSNKVYEDESVLAFLDIAPQAPVHILIVPKQHIESAQTLTPQSDPLLCHIFETARNLAKEYGIDQTGYRIITNVGQQGGQSVKHLHFHLIGGRTLKWEN
ncbi:MAG: histidine triad nucleotide-binding protein [Clostridia bacterium]|nr:histidine triad nucleotide-binding protein [Clostridia bacterium]